MPLRLKRPGDIGLCGSLGALGHAPEKGPRCESVGRRPRERPRRVEALHDLLGHCRPRVLSAVHSPRWQRRLET